MSSIDQMLFLVSHALHRDDLVLTRYGPPFRTHFRVVVYLRYGTFKGYIVDCPYWNNFK